MELLMVLGLAAMLAPAPAEGGAAEVLARRIEQRHRTLGDLTARFVQTYRSGAIGREIVEKGTLSIKPPGRMLWEYRDPEKKTFVSDGRRFYFYVPAERQVIVRDQADLRGIAATLLSGRGDILAQFQVALDSAPAGLERLVLVPRKPDPELEKAWVDVEATGRIRAIVLVDAQSNRSRFEFDDIRENVGLQDKLFEFRIPRGVEVITG